MNKEKKYTKSPLQLERNKFRLNKKKEANAFDIFKARDLTLYEDFIGMSLKRNENKALFAMQKILTAHAPSTNHATNATEFPSRLKFSLPEYYDAYGVGKRKTKRGKMEYNVRESELAIKALCSLGNKPHQLFYKRVHWIGDKENNENRRTSFKAFIGTLINFTTSFNDLKDNEVKELLGGKWSKTKMDERADIDVGLSVIITDQMGYYVLIPSNLYNDIKQITSSTSKYIPAFIQWCIVQAELKRRNKDFGTISIHRDKIARTLRMDYWIKTHRIEKINKTLQLCYEIAHKLGYLNNALSHEEIHVLTLNPEKYPYWNEERLTSQKLWHQKGYKREKQIEKRLKY